MSTAKRETFAKKERFTMKITSSFTTKNHIFQESLGMFGSLVQSELVRQIEYLKVENKILRSRLSKKIKLASGEQQQILRYGRPKTKKDLSYALPRRITGDIPGYWLS